MTGFLAGRPRARSEQLPAQRPTARTKPIVSNSSIEGLEVPVWLRVHGPGPLV